MPAGRGTAVVTNDHDGVAIAAGDAAAVIAATELDLEAKEPLALAQRVGTLCCCGLSLVR